MMEIDTTLDRTASKYKTLIEQGMTQNDVILHLNREGLSIIESIKIVRALYRLPLGEAKQIVSNHQVWETTVQNSKPLHEALEAIAESMEDETG